MQINTVQFNIAWEDRQANLTRLRRLLGESQIAAGSLIVLPEMFTSGFSMNVARIAETEPSETEAFLADISKQYQACVIGGLVYQNQDGTGRNELAVFGPTGELTGRYQKNRTFRFTGESEYYENGAENLVFDWGGFRISPLICYDLRFPELFRRATAQGADLFPVIASWPAPRTEHWITLLRARAIENLAIVAGANRCGTDPNFSYDGRSIIVDHQGAILADAGDAEICLSQEVSLEALQQWRDTFPALDDLQL